MDARRILGARRLVGAAVAAAGFSALSGVALFAQTVPPGAPAPVPAPVSANAPPPPVAAALPPGAVAVAPILPISDVPPPNTVIPDALADIPEVPVIFSYFGPWEVVEEILVPVLIRAAGPVGCWSAPNATEEDNSYAALFGVKDAGTEFIPFFARGTRLYVFDTGGSNYCWIDSNVAR